MFEGSRKVRRTSPLRFLGTIACATLLLGASCVRGAEHPVQYVDVTEEAGIDFVYTNGSIGEKYMPESMGSGAAFFDYDADGFLDLYIVNGAALSGFESAAKATNVLYRNRGDGTFADVTAATGVGDTGYGMGTVAGDYDNDGDLDLYVTNVGANVFYENGGDGRFADVTGRAKVGDDGWGTNASFVDYDNDGDLDLYVANYLVFTVEGHKKCRMGDVRVYCSPTAYEGQSGVMYRNTGDGTFTDVTVESGLYSNEGRQLGAVFGDCDEDGDLDLFVANDKTPNFLFMNDGNGRFEETGLIAGVAYNEEGEPESAMGGDLGDYDNDGRLDVIVATYQWVANTLYHNDGEGMFTDITFASNLGAQSVPYLGMTAAFLDYDNDGHLDIFLANGHIDDNVEEFDASTSYGQKNQLFRNLGDGGFREVTEEAGSGLQAEKVSHGAAFGDYDNDGDTDIFVSDSNGQPSQLLRNDGGNRNHYLAIEAIGTQSNRDGIGARIKVAAGDLTQVKEVRTSYGYLSANDPRVLFGLGGRTRVDRIEIRWPNGQVQVLEDIEADQILTIEEE
jgi:enediyne biosynthesis protein E4